MGLYPVSMVPLAALSASDGGAEEHTHAAADQCSRIPGPLQLLYAHLVQSQSQKMTLAWSLPQQASVDLLLQPSEPPPCHS